MRWTSMAPIGLALAFGTVSGARLQAQATDSTTGMVDSSASTVVPSTPMADAYLTNDGYGLGRVVTGSIQDVMARARSTMIKMKIVEGRSQPPKKGWQELLGRKGHTDVSIRLRAQGDKTRVEVHAQAGPTAWDQGLTQQLLDAISTP